MQKITPPNTASRGRRVKKHGTEQEKAEATAALKILARRVDLLAQQHAAALTEREQAIREAAAAGLTYRDIGDLLDLSHTRVTQILRRGTVSSTDKVKTLSPANNARAR